MTNLANESQYLLQQIASLLLYQSVFNNKVGTALIKLLQAIDLCESKTANRQLERLNCLQAYGHWFKTLATSNQSWQDYLVNCILQDDNPFSRQVQQKSLASLSSSLVAAAKHDLQILQHIYNCSTEQISKWVQVASQSSTTFILWSEKITSNAFLHQQENWSEALADLATYYRQNGTGIFAQYRALRWQAGRLQGIPNPDPIELSAIVGYETQKEALLKNTQFLLAGYPALHVLLYGSRGSGKSSLVKGLLQKYGDDGLRLIEVSKSELKDLPVIIDRLRDLSQKFIIFVDDLSFEEDDDGFKALKVVLEGSLTARANNTIVYATSNRRHLVREFFDDRPNPSEGEEVHAWDTVQEKLSFSDRFGLTLTFEPADQNTYLTIVNHLARQAKINVLSDETSENRVDAINISQKELEFRAKQWATRHNGRSGRTARQFIDYLCAELGISPLDS